MAGKSILSKMAEHFLPKLEEKLPSGTFSPLARALVAAPQERATGDQWANYFVNRDVLVDGQRFPVRPEELRMTGIGNSLLSAPSETVSREDLLARLRDVVDVSYPSHNTLKGRSSSFRDASEGPQYRNYQSPGKYSGYQENLTSYDDLAYNAPHFRESGHAPGLLSHSRHSVRNLPGGRSVHVDEIQSDLHQAARDAGGYLDDSVRARRETLDREAEEIVKIIKREATEKRMAELALYPNREFSYYIYNHPRYPELESITDQHNKYMKAPVWAPYSKTYHEQEFNKALRQAANQDIPNVTWTTGRQQANRWDDDLQDFTSARFDPSKRVLTISGKETPAIDKGGKMVFDVGGNELRSLPSLFGNDIANRLMKGETIPEGWVGGGGFRDFYDGTVRKYAQSFERRFPGDAQYGMQQFDVPYKAKFNKQSFIDSMGDSDLTGPSDIPTSIMRAASNYVAGGGDKNKLISLLRDGEEFYPLDGDTLTKVMSNLDNQRAGFGKIVGNDMYKTVHGLALGPQARDWIRRNGLPIATASPLAIMATQED